MTEVRDHAKWDPRFLAMAALVATWSKDPNKQVGAVLVSPDGRRVSWGYNGLPRGFPDDVALDKAAKNRYSLHAEDNAVAQAGCDITGWSLYVTEPPCLDCALVVRRAGVKRIICGGPIKGDSTWARSQTEASDFLTSYGVEQLHAVEVTS